MVSGPIAQFCPICNRQNPQTDQVAQAKNARRRTVSATPFTRTPSRRLLLRNYSSTMSGAAAGTRVADVLHKTVTTGLVLITVAGIADVVRGFSVLTKRNIDRRAAPDAATEPTTTSRDD